MTPLLKAEVFEFYVREMAKELRGRFSQLDISRLQFEVDVSGPVDSDDLLITFEVGNSIYGETVKAGTVTAAFEEFLRRKGWKAENAALCLPRVEDPEPVEANDDKPF